MNDNERKQELELILKKAAERELSEEELAQSEFIWNEVIKGTPDAEIMRALGYTEDEIALCSPIDGE